MPTLKIAYFGPKISQETNLKLDDSKAKIEGDMKNVCCFAICVDLQHILNHKSNPMKTQFLP